VTKENVEGSSNQGAWCHEAVGAAHALLSSPSWYGIGPNNHMHKEEKESKRWEDIT
jgi:hypothetical protein